MIDQWVPESGPHLYPYRQHGMLTRYGLSASAFDFHMSLTCPCGILDCNTKLALVICTAGILLFGVVSCVYDWIAAAAL
jgi:hypothetical protein